jgi:hypothetical protein
MSDLSTTLVDVGLVDADGVDPENLIIIGIAETTQYL